MRAEKAQLDVKPRGGTAMSSPGGVRFDADGRGNIMSPPDINKLRALQDEDELQTHPPNITAFPDGRGPLVDLTKPLELPGRSLVCLVASPAAAAAMRVAVPRN